MAAAQQGQAPIFDFRVISDDGNKELQPGMPWSERVWMSDSVEGWEHGEEEIGKVTIYPLGPQGSPEFFAAFEFANPAYAEIWVMGKVPGGPGWQGKGRAKAKGGGRAGAVDVEFLNPKGWG